MPKQRTANLLWCLAIGWCFVAPKTAWGKARRGSIAAALCDRGATKPQAVFGATLRAAVLFASRFVARSSQTAEGYARRSRLAGNENSLRRNTSQLRDTTLGYSRLSLRDNESAVFQPAPIQEVVAADVRRLRSSRQMKSEPPYVGCYVPGHPLLQAQFARTRLSALLFPPFLESTVKEHGSTAPSM